MRDETKTAARETTPERGRGGGGLGSGGMHPREFLFNFYPLKSPFLGF